MRPMPSPMRFTIMRKKITQNNIIHFSRFVPVTGSGGGARRTRQMLQVLESFQPQMISAGRRTRIPDLSPGDLGFPDTTVLHYYSGRDGKLKYWSTFDLKTIGAAEAKRPFAFDRITGIFKTGKGAKHWSREHKQKVNRLCALSAEWARQLDLSVLDLAFVDDPVYFFPLTERLKKIGVPVVAVSHNIESLASHQVNRRYRQHLFNREVEILAACDLVVTISREEAWLLKNLDINALFFPYYPVEEILNRLLAIRKNRKKTKKRDFLLMGTTINEATRQGMFSVIDHWKRQELFREGDRLLVAGFMSDIFLKEIKSEKNIEVLGPLPDEELDRIFGSVRANIVYQDWGSGALTRIMETLAAGVPLLINSHAARSYHNMTGVIEFNALHELGDLFREIEKVEMRFPVPPRPDAAFLTTEIERIRGRVAPPREITWSR